MAERSAAAIFTSPVLILEQRITTFDVDDEYTILDGQGATLGEVRQFGQAPPASVLRFFGTVADPLLPVRLRVTDAGGDAVLVLDRPVKVVRSRLLVEDGEGNEVGRIVQLNAWGMEAFSLQVDGEELVRVIGQTYDGAEFVAEDRRGSPVARITRSLKRPTWRDALLGGARVLLRPPDRYVLEILEPIDHVARRLVVAAVLAIDVALHQE